MNSLSPKAVHKIQYLCNEPIANLPAVRAAYSWLGVDTPTIVYINERKSAYNVSAEYATHFSVIINSHTWWNYYIHNDSLLKAIDNVKDSQGSL
jgi:hypothetical protein